MAAELTQLAEEETVAWRGERRVMRLVRSARILPPPVAPCANETILITGGLGGVGLALAEWLVERGARHLCLLGRRPPLPATARMLAAWRARGAQVMTAEVDVADEAALAGALAELRRVLPPLGTVFHAAGVLDDAPFQELGVERIAAVLAPKVAGALGLHRLTQGDPVRAFVLFSSASTLLGLPGQAAYAAANAVLDGLAQVRHSEGLPALAVNWGAWGEVGLAARADRSALLAARGFAPMPPDEALDLLARLQTVGVTHAAAMRFDAAAWRSASAQPASGLLKAFVELAAPQAAGDAAEAVRRATPEARVAAVIAYLSRTAIEILRSSAARIEPEQSLLALGFDSLMTLTLRTRIQRDLAVRLTPVAVLEHPTLRGLARHVDAQLASADTRVAELSDDEVDALLRQVLTR